MDTLIHADVFFLVTTVTVAIFGVGVLTAGYYLIKILRDLKEVSAVLKQLANNAGEEVHELWERLHRHSLFSLLFGRRSTGRERKVKKIINKPE